jgi:hypothetical protein
MQTNTKSTTKEIAGVMGIFSDPQSLLIATTKLKQSGQFTHFDAYTPYPIHGLEHAAGLKRSPLPWVTLIGGLTGFTIAWLLQWGTSVMDWPIIVGGKPFNSWPAFVPVLFELTVLIAALSTVGAMFFLNGLPNIKRAAYDPRITRDKFALVIEVPPPKKLAGEFDDHGNHLTAPSPFNEQAALSMMNQLGAEEVKTVYAEGWF